VNRSKEEALNNIKIKINILESWLKNGLPLKRDDDGHRLLDDKGLEIIDDIPTTVRQFLGWTGSKNCKFNTENLPFVRSLNNSTLAQHKLERERVENITKKLKEKIDIHNQKCATSEIKRYEAEKRELIINLNHASEENLLLRRVFNELEKKHTALLREARGHEQEFAKTYQLMDKEIERLKRQVSDLTVAIAKVRPLEGF
tara:strand:+ start:797 stop:1399 length:603 start_codon:yes stop_codon:yes gene_type:complete